MTHDNGPNRIDGRSPQVGLFGAILIFPLGLMWAQSAGTVHSTGWRVLDRFVGVWDHQVTVRMGRERNTFNRVDSRRWSPGGKYLTIENSLDTEMHPDIEPFYMVVTYNSSTNEYPASLMSGPNRSFLTGMWDEDSSTMHWNGRGLGDDATRIVGQHRFIEKAHAEAHFKISSPNGEVIMDLFSKQTRRLAEHERSESTPQHKAAAELETSSNSIEEFNQGAGDGLDWGIVNDGVMGGMSNGRASLTPSGTMLFEGTLSLANNGGFSSIRTSQMQQMDMSVATGIALRVRGDGRTYQLRLATDARYLGTREVAFKADFSTKEGQWLEVAVPFDAFSGSYRGQDLPTERLDSAKIERIGLLLGDKKPGPFSLEVDWIRTYGPDGEP